MAKIHPQILAVFRTAAKANSYAELETAVVFSRLRSACASLVEAHERAAKQAAERKEARRWTPGEDEILRLGFREGRTVGELADQLGRTPLVVEKRLAALGLLKIADIRRATPGEPPTSVADKGPLEPHGLSLNPEPDKGPEINLAVHSCDSSEDELYDRYAEELTRDQVEADRAREEELQTELEELQAAADTRAAEEQAALDDLPDEEAAQTRRFAIPGAGAGRFRSQERSRGEGPAGDLFLPVAGAPRKNATFSVKGGVCGGPWNVRFGSRVTVTQSDRPESN
jgi:hypothetical protein